MAMITITTENELLRRYFLDLPNLWKTYSKNLNKAPFILSLPLLIIASALYVVYLIFYSVFLICSFAQDFESDYNINNKFLHILVYILKFILLLPSWILIAFAYYPAIFIGGIITIITYPCTKAIKNLLNKIIQEEYLKISTNLLDEDNKGD